MEHEHPLFFEKIETTTVKLCHDKVSFAGLSGMLTWLQLQLVLTEMGADHVIWAQDDPYVTGNVPDFLSGTPISDEDKEKIAHGNIEKLLKLK